MNEKSVLQPVTESAKPILRWAGSKKKIIPSLKQYWTDNNFRYLEPFVGSGQLFFSICPESAVLGDTNKELIDLYLDIRDNYQGLFDLVSQFKPSKENYYILRSKNIEDLTQLERSARFVCLNRYCFNGLYRTNKKGQFNVPYTNGKSGRLPTLEELKAISESLQRVTLVNDDFEKLVREHIRPGDFIYLDPPYAVSNSNIFTQYGPHSFGTNDIERMSELLRFIHSKKATFLLSYADCNESRSISREWHSRIIDTQRNIAGFSTHRKIEKELLISNIAIK